MIKRILLITFLLLFCIGSVYAGDRRYVCQTLSYSATKSISPPVRGDSYYFINSVTGNITWTIRGGVQGDSCLLFLTSDAGGGDIMTFGTGCTSTGTMTLIASQTSIIRFTYTGSTWKEEYRINGNSMPILPVAGSSGTILRSNGTNWVATTSTFADTYPVNTLLYNATANIVSGLATGNDGILKTSGAGVPSIATDIPTAVTIGSAYIYRAAGTDVPITDGGTGQSTKGPAFDALSPMSALGDLIYGGASGTGTLLAGNTTTTTKYLQQIGTGAVSAVPSWNQVSLTAGVSGILPTANGGSPATRVIELFRSTYRPSPDGTSNSGILTDVYDITNFINYIRWTSGSATQDYDIWYEAVLPTDFVSFSAGALSIMIRSNDLAGNAITLSMYDNGNIVDTGISAVVLTPSIVDVWDTKTDTPDTPTTPYAVGHKVHVLIKLKNDEAANTVDIAGLKLTYNTR